MCRLLAMRSNELLDIGSLLQTFAKSCKESKEYQGHGWGIYYQTNNGPKIYHALNPIWEDDLEQFEASSYLLAHARSAFQDDGIALSNNMPFINQDLQFMFNGELHGVKLKIDGSTGAHKLFHLFQKLHEGTINDGLQRLMRVINRRSDHIRAANIILGDGREFYVYSQFNEDPDYFTLQKSLGDSLVIIASDKLAGDFAWYPVEQNEVIIL